ncbi:hypothetical protein CYMTET_36659, partial [Cymbomonas tetramitiformis]
LKKLLKGGADIMERDSTGRTAMHLAAEKGNLHMLEVLCQKGGIVGAEDMCGQTAMHIAAKVQAPLDRPPPDHTSAPPMRHSFVCALSSFLEWRSPNWTVELDRSMNRFQSPLTARVLWAV